MKLRFDLARRVAGLSLMLMPAVAMAQEAAPVPEKGDTAWMMVSTLLVLLMILPGLQLFYGGLVRAKNMLSMMTQVGAVTCLVMLLWVTFGYSLAFGPDSAAPLTPFIAGLDRLFLAGITPDSTVATFTDGIVIPEYVFICFQMTFAAITVSILLGAVVERMKFSAVLLFTLIWMPLVYLPIAHMVWAGSGLFFAMGALDFAGGTVVHINAGVAALVAAIVVGKRLGYAKDSMAPHSLTLTLVGTGMLWVGWFGFNAGSALEANGSAALAMINTFVATAAAGLAWLALEALAGQRPSALGLASGILAGLVAVTPAAGNAGPFGAIVLGAVTAAACYLAVARIRPRLGYDDSLDAFGIHGVGGIMGAIGTAIVYAPALGGPGAADYDMMTQLGTQLLAVLTTIGWSVAGTLVALFITKAITGLRVAPDAEREGLDLAEHGERAYNL
ncbi:ammonium transporter [Sandarakinorhabdus sp.]|uniref:ammonium transporter n=1 Tax=Sandarakinorhabdus sp. TaxID=1916663 RepID=UPI003F708A41